jgi:hypothetical protein
MRDGRLWLFKGLDRFFGFGSGFFLGLVLSFLGSGGFSGLAWLS